MSSKPDPARVSEYRTKLSELLASRDAFRSQRNEPKVRLLNRQIQAQKKWIKRALAEH